MTAMDARSDSGARLLRADASSGNSSESSNCGADLESTASLLFRARDGDSEARNRLFDRYFLAVKRWARGRLPHGARDLAETDDLVQISMLRALEHLEGFEPRRKGAFLAYLRRIVMNQVRDEIRRAGHRPRVEELSENVAGRLPNPFDETVTRQSLEAYERALSLLPERTRHAVTLRLELGLSYSEVAEQIGNSSPNATRMMITRALVHMAEEMNANQ